MDSTFSFGLFDIVFALVVVIAIVAGAVFFIQMRRNNRTPSQQLEVLREDPRTVELVKEAREFSARALAEARAALDRAEQGVTAIRNKGQIQKGQIAFDQWDAIGPFWATDNEIRFDDKILRTGEQPAYTFRSQEPAPGGNVPVMRES